MTIEFGLTDEFVNTKYAPLAALAVRYQRNQTLKPLEGVEIPMKTREFTPPAKLKQVLLSILAGCVTLSEVNTKLEPEQDLATVWQWERFADQSCLSRTLDALTLMNIDELREAVAFIRRANGQTVHHDWRGYLWLDFDLSGLPCSKQAEKSQKGYFGEKNVTGRQLARVSAIEYRETIWSDLFAGNQHTVHCFQPAVLAACRRGPLVVRALARFCGAEAPTTSSRTPLRQPASRGNCFRVSASPTQTDRLAHGWRGRNG